MRRLASSTARSLSCQIALALNRPLPDLSPPVWPPVGPATAADTKPSAELSPSHTVSLLAAEGGARPVAGVIEPRHSVEGIGDRLGPVGRIPAGLIPLRAHEPRLPEDPVDPAGVGA